MARRAARQPQPQQPTHRPESKQAGTGRNTVRLVFAGGIGLGAYQAGAYEALHERDDLHLDWIAASSVGAVNAALIGGVPKERRLARLREFWMSGPWSVATDTSSSLGSSWEHAKNWASVLQARLFGVEGHFRPRWPVPVPGRFGSLYDLAPMRSRIEKFVDFELLNAGDIRLSVATTDIETGDLVLFDNASGHGLRIQHLEASCGFLPEFAPVEIDGRLLGDGGLSANAPIEAVIPRDSASEESAVFVLDLYARDGARPDGLETALARKSDLLFANQTWLRLQAVVREQELQAQIAAGRNGGGGNPALRMFYLSYRAPPEEAGAEKPFDLSRATVEGRWQAGFLDMCEALRRYDESDRAEILTAIRRS